MDADEPIVESLRTSRFFALFLGLILNIIIFVLTGLSVLLIYSLLMVNVETRTFEVRCMGCVRDVTRSQAVQMGVMRMIGVTRIGILELLFLQAFGRRVV